MKVFGTDYDGVIINIEPQKAAAFGTLLWEEWHVDREDAAKSWIVTGGLSRRNKFDYYYEKQFRKKLPDAEYEIIETKFSSLLKNEFYPNIELLPGVLDLLKYVKANFDFTFVSSGVPMKEIQYLVRLNGLSEYFDLILGTDHIYKTKHEHFKRIINEQHPNLFIFTADGLEDMRIAKKYRATSIGVTTNHPKEDLIESGADYIVKDLSETLSLVDSIINDDGRHKK